MAYLALYRMFRPATLDDVVRQEHIVTILRNQIETGRIGHAYLFCGPRGTGKTSIAKIFAAAINCEHPVNGSACGKCSVCRALADPSNLDISEIDAASNNGVDEMRDLREKVQYPPVAGKYKVYIVDEVHMLSAGAFNALLKTLEEPPAHAVFILATTEAQKIPATILSRCMRFDFKLIPQADLEARLKKILDKIGKGYEEEAVSAIARAGAGSVRDMLSVADTCVSYSRGKLTYRDVTAALGGADFDETYALCSAILAGDGGTAFEKAEKILSEGKSIGLVIKDVLGCFIACTVAKTCRDANKILAYPEEDFKKIAALAKGIEGHRLLRATEIFARTETELKYSASPRIIFETAVFKASMPEADYDLESLLARIAELEKKVKEGFVSSREKQIADSQKEQNEAPTVATNAILPEEKAEDSDAIDDDYVEDNEYEGYEGYDDAPPLEEPTEDMYGGVPFPSSPVNTSHFAGSTSSSAPIAPTVQPKEEKTASSGLSNAPSAPAVRQAPKGDAKVTFGLFLRTLRKLGKNGVLYTVCMDLENEYEGDKFVLTTTSETIYRSVMKEEHYTLVKQAMDAIGISDFEVRLRGKPSDQFNKNLSELKEKFAGVTIKIK